MTKREVLEAAARGEGCLGRSADDEPVFILVARDILAADTVRHWRQRAFQAGVSADKRNGAEKDAVDMDTWRDAHGGKVPD